MHKRSETRHVLYTNLIKIRVVVINGAPFHHQRKQIGKTPTPFPQLVLAKNSRRSANRQTQTCDNDRTDVRRGEATFPVGARLTRRIAAHWSQAFAVRTMSSSMPRWKLCRIGRMMPSQCQQYTQFAGSHEAWFLQLPLKAPWP
jgi:hypothetical protein